ncbi:MAG: molybdenum cofactor biosynthesis protein MoaE [Deltaproteobacteria bacterium]|nr:molybdenum cofactor biosynthesis protein MoaE [Deltaproteobacteria bacterium]
MDINRMIETMKAHPESHRIGMIASHMGVVRGTSRDGREVTGIDVVYDHEVLEKIVEEIRAMPGIVEVLVDTSEGRLSVGDEVLAVAVGGDIREHVFAALMEAVNRIKAESSRKREHFK